MVAAAFSRLNVIASTVLSFLGGNIQTLFSSEFPPSFFNIFLFPSTTPLPGFSGHSGFLSRNVPRPLWIEAVIGRRQGLSCVGQFHAC